MSVIRYDVDKSGIATLTWDLPEKPVNILSPESRVAFVNAIDKALSDDSVTGIVIASAKRDFIVGADLRFLQQFRGAAVETVSETFSVFRDALRRMEASTKPVVAAISGSALGGGLELCLACNHRILVDRPDAMVGLPEATLGLLPGAGGTQRLPRMIGIAKALPLLLDGRTMPPQKALELGIVDAIVSEDQLLSEAREWVIAKGTAKQPWDESGYKIPGAAPNSPEVHRLFVATGAKIQAQTRDLMPAPRAILSCVFEGVRIPMDQALAVELSYFVSLVRGDVAQNIVRTNFFGISEAKKLAARPSGIAPLNVRKLGIIGAGLMGTGLAEVAALSGLDVVLIDQDAPSATKAHERIASAMEGQVKKGRLTAERAQSALARITPTDDYAVLAGSDAIVEAVFENRDVKAGVTKRALEAAGPDILFASNTSKIPISGLAANSPRPDRFIGLHFFSPVPRMPLLEIIRGQETSDETLAHALDLCKILKKTPIVVHDGPGFYTSRCVGTYLNEGITMLSQGVAPAIIENSGKAAGMPLGPLALADEIGLDLMYQVRVQERKDGVAKRSGPEFEVLGKLATDLGRPGRKGGAGFFEYPPEGERVLWSELTRIFPPAAQQPSGEEVQRRLMHVQALEAARCFDEGIIDSPRDADIGSILGWGFARHTGGVISYVDTIGVREFVEQADLLSSRYGDRYEAPAKLREMAEAGQSFHQQAELSSRNVQ